MAAAISEKEPLCGGFELGTDGFALHRIVKELVMFAARVVQAGEFCACLVQSTVIKGMMLVLEHSVSMTANAHVVLNLKASQFRFKDFSHCSRLWQWDQNLKLRMCLEFLANNLEKWSV